MDHGWIMRGRQRTPEGESATHCGRRRRRHTAGRFKYAKKGHGLYCSTGAKAPLLFTTLRWPNQRIMHAIGVLSFQSLFRDAYSLKQQRSMLFYGVQRFLSLCCAAKEAVALRNRVSIIAGWPRTDVVNTGIIVISA